MKEMEPQFDELDNPLRSLEPTPTNSPFTWALDKDGWKVITPGKPTVSFEAVKTTLGTMEINIILRDPQSEDALVTYPLDENGFKDDEPVYLVDPRDHSKKINPEDELVNPKIFKRDMDKPYRNYVTITIAEAAGRRIMEAKKAEEEAHEPGSRVLIPAKAKAPEEPATE